MKKSLIFLAIGMILLGLTGFAQAQCPEDTVDSGICDTLYVNYYQNPENPIPPTEVYFTLQVTHDLPNPDLDSISGIVIPLKFTHTNPAAYCSIPDWRNKVNFHPDPDTANNIFRHFRGMENRMMSLYEQGNGAEWDARYLEIDYDTSGAAYFFLSLVPMGSEDQKWWEGSKTLLATITLLVEDTMTICVDTCFWPPNSRFSFTRWGDVKQYVPRHFMPLCKVAGPDSPPPLITCPPDESRHTNGTFQTDPFSAWSEQGQITSVYPDFSGSGITDIEVVYTEPPPASYVEGYVVYTVTDHCVGSGSIGLLTFDDIGIPDECWFPVFLSNNPPALDLPDIVLIGAERTLQLEVYASDPDNDSVGIVWDAFWFEHDSLQAPTNHPSYDGGNPGIFTWTATEADTGTWLSSFSATDICGAEDTRLISILVLIPNRGDCNSDGVINSADVVYLINYLFKNGETPNPLWLGDCNCDGVINSADVVYLINYLFKDGPGPCS
jgi:hypothetical protein